MLSALLASVNILDVGILTPDYNTSLTYVYDQLSGMLLESRSETVPTQPEQISSIYSYEITETNIFGSSYTQSPSPTSPPTTVEPTKSTSSPQPSPAGENAFFYFLAAVIAVVVILLVVLAIVLRRK